MQRSTKIVATLGPASSDPEVMTRMIAAGVDVVRLNFSHGTADDHRQRVALLREVVRKVGRTVGVMVDLQGPKIRVGKFAAGKAELKPGSGFILDASGAPGDATRVGLDYPDLVDDLAAGDVLLLDDGRIVLEVDAIIEREVRCRVRVGGVLSNNKGINKQGGGLSAPALTAKDMEDIRTAAEINCDFVAVSFPKSGADMRLARELLRNAGSDALLVAKIERVEAIAALEDILHASDAIMVARGDLAVEVGDAAVPALQKRMTKLAREKNKVVITATQMMESMIENPIPTRAEVSDVANAVLDGTDAVMLSAETAAGKYPVEAISAMHRVCLEAEKEYDSMAGARVMDQGFLRVDEAIAMSAAFTALHLNIKAIAAMTQSGSTALWMSRISTHVPIYALTPEVETRRKVTLFRGVYPVNFKPSSNERDQLLSEAEDELRRRGAVRNGDLILLTIGEPIGKPGGTNTMKIVRVGERKKA